MDTDDTDDSKSKGVEIDLQINAIVYTIHNDFNRALPALTC